MRFHLFLVLSIFSIRFLKAVITISDYCPSDKNSVLSILFQDPLMIFPGKEWVDNNEMSLEDFRAKIKESIDEELSRDFIEKKVMHDQENVIGFVSYCNKGMLEEKHIELSIITINKLVRRKGLATILLKSVIEDSRKKWPDIKKIKVDVISFNIVAQKFYEINGFTKCEDSYDFCPMITYEKYF